MYIKKDEYQVYSKTHDILNKGEENLINIYAKLRLRKISDYNEN